MAMTRRAFLAGIGAGIAAPCRTPRAAPGLIERALPRSGERLPVIGLGTWQAFDVAGAGRAPGAARATLARFAELGGRVVDSSPMYGRAEAAVGTFAAEFGIGTRLYLATKVWTRGRAEGERQLADSHARLRRDVLDLVQVHNLLDAETQFALLREARAAGGVRHLGVTHYTAAAHPALERWLTREGLDAIQVNYSLAEPEAGRRLLDAAAAHGVAVLVNRPFAEGALLARVRGRALPAWAAELGCGSAAQLLLKWILAHRAVTCVLVGTRNPEHVADNLAAAREPLPNAAERARIAAWVADG
jgi:aryl-alcohol dehydrogenase-like predicted oxidoreductase